MGKKQQLKTSDYAIRSEWTDYLVESGKFDSAADLAKCCFACGLIGPTERAHIVPRCHGGDDSPGNLHLLCHTCHKDSESLGGSPAYWGWFHSRTMRDALVSGALRGGLNFSAVLAAYNGDIEPLTRVVRAVEESRAYAARLMLSDDDFPPCDPAHSVRPHPDGGALMSLGCVLRNTLNAFSEESQQAAIPGEAY